MRRWAPLLLLLAACHSKKTEDAPAPAPPTIEPAPPPLPTVSLARLNARESSGLVLARVDSALHAFVADEDDQSIVEIDPESKAVVQTTKINERPRDLLVLADGRLAATLPDAGIVAIYTRDIKGTLVEAARVKTPSEPLAMAVDAKETLYVTTGASHSLLSYETSGADFKEQRRLSLGREPRAVLIDGDRAFVTHAIEEFVSVVAADGSVTTTDIDNTSSCAPGSHCTAARTARHAQSIARYGEHGIIVPAAQMMPVPSRGFSKSILCPPRGRFVGNKFVPNDPDGPFSKKKEVGGYGFGDEDNGPPVTSDLTIIDGNAGKKWATANPPGLGVDCMQPRAAAADEGSVLVACMGSSRVMRYAPSMTGTMHWGEETKLNFEAKGKAPWGSYPNGITPNITAVKIDVPMGPSALAMGEKGDSFVWSSLARQLTRIRANKAEPVVEVPRAAPVAKEWLAGRDLFYTNNDSRISRDGRACANCHIDGADDGLTWKTPDGPRRTRLLRGELASGPYGWMGEHKTLKEHVEVTLKNLKGKGLEEADLANLLTYVSQMKKPKLQPVADVDRGKQIFAQAECSHCHTAGSTDRQVHDVGTGGSFMTPTLASSGTRRALMHDGRFKNLDELLAGTPNMGRGSELGADDKKALEAYLETL